MDIPDRDLQQRVARLLHKRPVAWRRAIGGYTPAERWVAGLDDGTSCFVKAGPQPHTAGWLRDEYRKVYSQVEAPFIPKLLGWEDDGETPLLILEDLSNALWPPPWREGDVGAVLEALAGIHRLRLAGLPAIRLHYACRNLWPNIEAEPGGFLSLGLATSRWLQECLPTLVSASDAAAFDGDQVVHFDVRSDNLCFANAGRCVLIDWNHASIGNGDLDIATWLPSLEAEGGPAPETILRDGGGFAAWMSGFWGWHAGGREGDLRRLNERQLRSALPWAVRALDLPPLDGPNAPRVT